eukprot:6192606-Pleurochrysis_carterae.AAC.2
MQAFIPAARAALSNCGPKRRGSAAKAQPTPSTSTCEQRTDRVSEGWRVRKGETDQHWTYATLSTIGAPIGSRRRVVKESSVSKLMLRAEVGICVDQAAETTKRKPKGDEDFFPALRGLQVAHRFKRLRWSMQSSMLTPDGV